MTDQRFPEIRSHSLFTGTIKTADIATMTGGDKYVPTMLARWKRQTQTTMNIVRSRFLCRNGTLRQGMYRTPPTTAGTENARHPHLRDWQERCRSRLKFELVSGGRAARRGRRTSWRHHARNLALALLVMS